MRDCLNPADPICRKGCAGNSPCDYATKQAVNKRDAELSRTYALHSPHDLMVAVARLEKLNTALETRISQFQFCINRVAEALGNVCCGGVDSSPENQLSDPHSTTRVLCDAIAKLHKVNALQAAALEVWRAGKANKPAASSDEVDFIASLRNSDGL